MTNKKNILKKVYIFFIVVFTFGVCVGGQIVNIQYFQKDKILSQVSSTTAGYQKVKANRGDIYAYDGSLLATSLNYYIVGMDLGSEALTDENFNKHLDALCDSLSAMYLDKSKGKFREELINARKKRQRWYKIDNSMAYNDFERLKKFPLFNLGRYKSGLVYRKFIKREKPFGVLASRTIGSRAPFGLEGAFDHYLRGKDGEQYQRKISGGVWVTVNDQNSIDPVDGYDVLSTIDIGIQEIVEDELKNRLFHHQADHGCAVLMEVKTGKVRAIANLKVDTMGNYWEARNYAVGDAVEPGSTFKLASLMALLEDDLVNLEDEVDVGYGVMRFYDRKMKDSHLYNERRTMTVREVFQESSNVGIAKLIDENYGENPQKFVDRLYGFGLQSKLGLNIQGESSPKIKDPSVKGQWSGVTLPWSSIGYEVALTPMQILAFYSAVANDGKMLRPYFVEKVKKNDKVVSEFGSKVLNHAICSQSTLYTLQDLLKGVVKEGTAKWPFFNTSYSVAGKTGTSQINYASRKAGEKAEYRASFVGYFPADKPVYSCIVVVTNPKKNGFYGSQVAAPIFRKISDRLFTTCQTLHVNIDSIDVRKNDYTFHQNTESSRLQNLLDHLNITGGDFTGSEGWMQAQIKSDELKSHQKLNFKENTVPNVQKMPLNDAIYLLENRGLKIELEGSGAIQKQSIAPGTKVVKGKTIKLKLG